MQLLKKAMICLALVLFSVTLSGTPLLPVPAACAPMGVCHAWESHNRRSETLPNGYEVFIEDDDYLFSSEDTESLIELMKSEYIDGNLGIYVFSYDSERNDEDDTVRYAFSRYEKRYGIQNGTVLVIDMSTRYLEVISLGDNVSLISNYDAETIADDIYTYAHVERYYDAAYRGITLIQNLLLERGIPRPMKIICNIFFAVILALILNFYLLKGTSIMPKVSRNALRNSAKVSFSLTGEHPVYARTLSYDVSPGSVEAIAASKGRPMMFVHILILVLLCILRSGAGRSSGGHGGGSSSGGGGRRSSGGHRF